MLIAELLCENEPTAMTPGHMWLGPKGEVIKLDDSSHSKYIVEHPATFGLTDEALAHATRAWREEGGELDFDWIIARAEANGWVRVSEDTWSARQDFAAISAKDARGIHRAIRWLHEHGMPITAVDAEIETVVGDQVHRRYCTLQGDAFADFLRRGVLPRPV